MRAPTGSVPGLCSASATMFAVGMAFLGYWGVYEPVGWSPADYLVVVLAFCGFASLGLVPWLATRPLAEGEAETLTGARRALAVGFVLVWLSVLVAVAT